MTKSIEINAIKMLLSYDCKTGEIKAAVNGVNRSAGSVLGSMRSDGYLMTSVMGKRVYNHRLAWAMHYGIWPDKDIDHINGIKHDNRIENLRCVARVVNMQNKRAPNSDNTSGYLGVWFDATSKKWRAGISINMKKKTLGYFQTPEIAHEHYLSAKRKYHEGCTI